MRSFNQMTAMALGLCGLTTIAGCSSDQAGTPAPASQEAVGSADLDLQLADGRVIASATYTITGPNAFSKSGTINLTQATKLSAVVAGLPAGTGYQITITAGTTDMSASCSGSAQFTVQAGKTAAVPVALTCKEQPKAGSAMVNGALNVCPTIDGIGANPAEVQVGGTIALTALAHDSDAAPNALSFGWTATGGTLSSATGQSPTFTCGSTPGTASIALTVSDGDPDPSCAATLTTQVTCSVPQKTPGTYVAGDFHNHTTCSDGTISMQKLVKKATDKIETPWGLDWFVQAGHGGNGYRNCQLVEDASLSTPVYPYVANLPPSTQLPPGQSAANTAWVNSGVTPKGDVNNAVISSGGQQASYQNMWRWQSVQEFQYPLMEYLNAYKNLPLFLGIETVVPGHEHTSMSIITGQIPAALDTTPLPTAPNTTPLPGGPPYTALGNATALANWEYCFDRADTDTSRGVANNWDCGLPNKDYTGDPSWNNTAKKLIVQSGAGAGNRGHAKTLEAITWMKQSHAETSYYVPAHLERAGQFNPDGDNGFNVEHLRDFNNLAPRIAFGMETQPGHGASANRGEYQVLRQNIGGVLTDSVGGTTYGGTGVYGSLIGGVWDSLLGEGRNWWFFASSDWHNRGSFGPDDRRTTQDFFPGEYQRNYTMVRSAGKKPTPQQIVDGLRTGNNWAASGQIIDRLGFVACVGKSEGVVAEIAGNGAVSNTAIQVDGCATMGEKLVVPSGSDIVVGIAVRDPAGTNYSPYTFNNPSLLLAGINQPINTPVLDHIDLIRGLVTGYRDPAGPDYAGAWPKNTDWLHADGTTPADLSGVPTAAKNTTAAILRTFNGSGMTPWQAVTSSVDGTTFLTMTFKIPAASASQYVRLRGTNIPPSVSFETDGNGNPLADIYTNANDRKMLRIPCTITHSATSQFDGCPDHLASALAPSPIAGQRAVSFDVAAWADLWFYSNPIYIEVNGSTIVKGVQ